MIKQKSLVLSHREFVFLLLLIPFFKLLSFEMFRERNVFKSFFGMMVILYDYGRVIAASYGYLKLIMNKARRLSKISKLFILFFTIQLIACIANGSIDLFITAKIYTYIGFVLILNYLLLRYSKQLLNAVKLHFGILSILGVFTVMIFPFGFLHGSDVYDAVYLVGGKNSSFPFYYVFLLVFYVDYIVNHKYKLPKLWTVPLILTIIAVLICQSVNSALELTIIFTISTLYMIRKIKVNAYIPIASMYTMLILIYLGSNMPFINNFLEQLGRNSSFSGRTILWNQAFLNILSNPITGGGYKLVYNIWDGVTDHAHSWYLDTFAKYGVISLVAFALIIITVLNKLSCIRYKPLRCYLGLFFMVYLLHMGFDDYNFNFFVLIVMILYYIADVYKNSPLNLLK